MSLTWDSFARFGVMPMPQHFRLTNSVG